MRQKARLRSICQEVKVGAFLNKTGQVWEGGGAWRERGDSARDVGGEGEGVW